MLAGVLPAPKHSYQAYSDDDSGDDDAKPVVASTVKSTSKYIPQYPNRNALLNGVAFIPTEVLDYQDGGAYPEIHVVQYPLNMGKPGVTSTAVVSVDVDEHGQVKYDAIVKQGANRNKIVQTSLDDLKEKTASKDAIALPEETEEQETADRTRAALESLLEGKIKSTKPSAVVQTNDIPEPTYVRYTPNPNAPGFSGEAKQRVIRMVEAQVDPMEPPKHKLRKVPRGPPSPPVPVLHSPPRKLTVADQQAWKIPPCISNWKNARGYTIPLDKRLAADGRGLQEVTINNKFATLSESLYIAERKASEDLRVRNQIRKKMALKEKEDKEKELREMALKARMERAGVSAEDIAARIAASGGEIDDDMEAYLAERETDIIDKPISAGAGNRGSDDYSSGNRTGARAINNKPAWMTEAENLAAASALEKSMTSGNGRSSRLSNSRSRSASSSSSGSGPRGRQGVRSRAEPNRRSLSSSSSSSRSRSSSSDNSSRSSSRGRSPSPKYNRRRDSRSRSLSSRSSGSVRRARSNSSSGSDWERAKRGSSRERTRADSRERDLRDTRERRNTSRERGRYDNDRGSRRQDSRERRRDSRDRDNGRARGGDHRRPDSRDRDTRRSTRSPSPDDRSRAQKDRNRARSESPAPSGGKRAAATVDTRALEIERAREAEEREKAEREKLRLERRRERERQLRLENMKGNFRKNKMDRDEGRDISEKIALGMHRGSGQLTGEAVFDSRLFNQSAGLDTGFGADDDYSAFSKPLFDRGEATSVYRPKRDDADVYGDVDAQLAKLSDTSKFKPDKGFKGAQGGVSAGPRDAPVQFEKARDPDPFDLDEIVQSKRARVDEDD